MRSCDDWYAFSMGRFHSSMAQEKYRNRKVDLFITYCSWIEPYGSGMASFGLSALYAGSRRIKGIRMQDSFFVALLTAGKSVIL